MATARAAVWVSPLDDLAAQTREDRRGNGDPGLKSMPLETVGGPVVAVILPYYQRKPGILARALKSVFEQDFRGGMCVLVVDDASPVPASTEVAGLPERPDIELRVIEQANMGCGGARNTGMAAAPESARYFAFLDPDDWWSPDHLSRAVASLERGNDFYFSNWIPLGLDQDAHSYYARLKMAEHEPAPWADELWYYRGDFFRQELSKPIARVSSTVVARSKFGDLRYHDDFSSCCEDILYRLEIARGKPSIVFSSRVELYSGSGVNIFTSRPWGTVSYFEHARDQLEFAGLVRRRFELTAEEERIRRTSIARVREAAIANVFSLLKRGRRTPLASLRRLWAADPWFPVALPTALLRGMTGRLE